MITETMDTERAGGWRRAAGEPSLAVRGRAAELAAERGITRWHLSLTHSALVAIAYVVAE